MPEEEVITGTEPVAEPTAEQQPVETGVETPETEEPVDEKGVPIKNRIAEANRKLAKAEKLINQSQAQEALLNPQAQPDQDEALRIVRGLAQEEAKKMMEPILAKQFLQDNPDASEMIEDINRVRAQYPEISSVDKLDVAYKVAKAERQDELVKKQAELRAKELQEKQLKANRASVEGTGKSSAPAMSIADRISNAKSIQELKELENLLK